MSPNVKDKKLEKAKHLVNHKMLSRLATKRFVAKMTVPYLPTPNNPSVFRIMTKSQASNIPRDRYVVTEISTVRVVRIGQRIEKQNAYIIKLANLIYETAKDSRDYDRKRSRDNGGGGEPPDSGIFNRLVDEDKLSDCILHIVDTYFHGGEKCKICEVELNLCDFCLLMYYYFEFINILENTSQQPYCTYLKNKVFSGEDRVNVRSFNNYSKKDIYKSFHKILKDKEKKKYISFLNRPQIPLTKEEKILYPEKTLLAPFQEIGWKFQYSPYFNELRDQKEKVISFII